MKKRMLAGLLSLAMVLSMFPTALAAEGFTPADESEQNEPVCICETHCTEEAVNEDCPVCNGGAGYTACVGPAAEPQEDEPVCDCDVLCTEETVDADCPVCSGEGGFAACAGVPAEPEEDGSSVPWTELTPADPVDNPDRALMNSDGVYEVSTAAEFAEAIADIEQSGEPEVTISLTAPIELTDDTLGVADTLITITSSDATPVLLTLGGSTLRLAGDVTLENIYISADTIYAEGYALTLGDGFGGGDDGKTRMTVYGGSDRDLKVNTTSVTVEKITPKQSTAAPLRKICLRGFFCFPCWGSSTTFSRAACCSSLRGSRSGSASSRTVLSLRSSNRERS